MPTKKKPVKRPELTRMAAKKLAAENASPKRIAQAKRALQR